MEGVEHVEGSREWERFVVLALHKILYGCILGLELEGNKMTNRENSSIQLDKAYFQ